MAHASDLDDANLLAAGDIAALLARYEPVIRGRCIARLHGSLDAEDVAQDARLRLLDEFRRGKRYEGVPYRVVVHQVIGWTVADHFAGRPTDVPLPEGWEPSAEGDPADEVASRGWVEWDVQFLPGVDPGAAPQWFFPTGDQLGRHHAEPDTGKALEPSTEHLRRSSALGTRGRAG